jgi:pyruvate formate lyase activating enzyme
VLPKLDWVGIDVKAPVADYATVTAEPGSGISALASLDLVRNAGIAYEVRTTLHPLLTPPDAMERLARELAARGIRRWVLQAFRATGCANEALVAAASKNATLNRELLKRLSGHIPVIDVRV